MADEAPRIIVGSTYIIRKLALDEALDDRMLIAETVKRMVDELVVGNSIVAAGTPDWGTLSIRTAAKQFDDDLTGDREGDVLIKARLEVAGP